MTKEQVIECLASIEGRAKEIPLTEYEWVGIASAKRHLANVGNISVWKDAESNDLPELEREVIVLCQPHEALWEVCYAHRPSDSWTGISIITGKPETYYPQKYDKGGWSIGNVKYWLDLELPYNSESELKTE